MSQREGTTLPARILDASADAYHADALTDQPTLSASIARILCSQTPAHARAQHPRLNPDYKRAEEAKFDIGVSAHALFLEGVDNVHIVAADSWRTKAAQEERDEARAAGRVPLLIAQWEDVRACVDALKVSVGALEAEPPLFTDGKPERTLVWDEDGVACRARLDWLRDDLTAIDDLKTTARSAEQRRWGQHTLFGMGYDIQAAFYLRGLAAVAGAAVAGIAEFRFVVCEITPPYACSVVDLAPDALALADSKVDYALKVWKRCLESGRWDGYDRRVYHAEAPAWAAAQWFERQDAEEVAA